MIRRRNPNFPLEGDHDNEGDHDDDDTDPLLETRKHSSSQTYSERFPIVVWTGVFLMACAMLFGRHYLLEPTTTITPIPTSSSSSISTIPTTILSATDTTTGIATDNTTNISTNTTTTPDTAVTNPESATSSTSSTTTSNQKEDYPILIQHYYNTSDLCHTAMAILVQQPTEKAKFAKPDHFYECGQRRLYDDYYSNNNNHNEKDTIPTVIVLESLQVNRQTGVGTLSMRFCGDNQQQGDTIDACSSDNSYPFHASDLLLWVRIQSPTILMAVMAHAVDCRSWHANFQIPINNQNSNIHEDYQFDIRTMWLHGHPKHWISDNDRTDVQKDVTWNGTKYILPKGKPLIHGGYFRDGRWMKCADWCMLHDHCTHWTLHDAVQGFVTNTEKCTLFSNVKGSFQDKGAKSGYYAADERRVTYLGGLSVDANGDGKNNMLKRQICRDLSHVLGSPTQIKIPPLEQKMRSSSSEQNQNDGSNSSSRISQLPWCTANDIITRGQQGYPNDKLQNHDKEGFWAKAPIVYPESAAASPTCPEACTKNPPRHLANASTTCTPADTLPAGICALNDITPIYSGWHTGALQTAEPPVKELAWVERQCRYRLGTGPLFQQCLRDQNFHAIFIQDNDIFGELLDRWQLGRVDEWDRTNWKPGFEYTTDDWLFPTGRDVMPDQLRQHWTKRQEQEQNTTTGVNNTTNTPSLKAVVVQHLWTMMSPRLYNNHRFDGTEFAELIQSRIASWKTALESPDHWLSRDTMFVIVLSPSIHEFFGDPFYTHQVLEFFNEIARQLYQEAGWIVLDAMTITKARPDYRLAMSWWNPQSHPGEARSGCGVVYTLTNLLYNVVCN